MVSKNKHIYPKENEKDKNELVKKLRGRIKKLEAEKKMLKSDVYTLQKAFDKGIKRINELEGKETFTFTEETVVKIEQQLKETSHTARCFPIMVGGVLTDKDSKGSREKWICHKDCPIKGKDNE